MQQNGRKSTYKFFKKKVFQNINYYLLLPRAISEAPKSKKDEHIRIWEKSYGRAIVHRCVKKCPVRDNQFSVISL